MNAYIINGTPKASMSLAIDIAAGDPACDFFRMVSSDDTQATWETRRKDSSDPGAITYTATMAAEEAHMGPFARNHAQQWLCRVAAYKLAMLVYRVEVVAALGENGIEL